MDADVQELDNRLRLAAFRLAKLTWPFPGPGDVVLTLDLEREGIRVQHTFALPVERTQTISEVRVPRHAFFSSSMSLALREKRNGWDILEPEKLSISGLAKVQYHSVELLPDRVVFRRRWIQKNRKYIFPENLVMMLIVAAVSAAFGAWVAPVQDS